MGSGVATTRGSLTSGQKPAAPGHIPVTATATWWQVPTNTTSRAGPHLSQPSDVHKPEVNPWKTHCVYSVIPYKIDSDGLGPSSMQAEDPMVDRAVVLLHTNAVTWTACLGGGRFSGVQQNLSCSGGGKTEDSLALLHGTREGRSRGSPYVGLTLVLLYLYL